MSQPASMRNVMNTVLRLSLGLLLAASMVGCNSCGHQSCLHKAFNSGNNGCGCGCHDGGGYDTDGATCDCGQQHAPRMKHHRVRSKMQPDAVAHGYDGSVVYTGDDWQGIPQQAPGMTGAPFSSGCSGCGGGPSMSPMPSAGGCSGCGGGPISAPPIQQGGGCASCGGGIPSQVTPSIPSSGGCASCGAAAGHESFYSPMTPNHGSPAPAPPAEGIPGQNESSPGDKASTQGESIQKINWVPRQL